MNLAELRAVLPDYARDIRLNLETVLAADAHPHLTPAQVWGTALACAYALGNKDVVEAVLNDAQGSVDDATVEAAKGAATIMAMNNVYYRSIHLMDDAGLKSLPARLRMNIIGRPGIAKVDFELMSFAVSALAGCGQCLTAHLNELRKAGMSDEGAQGAIRIASVLNAAASALRTMDASAS